MRDFRKALVVFLSLVLVPAFLLGASFLEGPGQAEELLLDRRYEEAARELSRLLEKLPAGAERERVLFLLGEARLLSGQVDEAARAFDRLLKESPRSPWANRAAFGKARALAEAKRFREAAEILEKQVGALVSEKRKEEVAGVYLRLAAKALQGEKPDHRKAVTFCDLALDLGLRGSRAEEVFFLAAKEALASRDYKGAARRFRTFLEKWPDSSRRGEAIYLLGEGLRRSGILLEARKAFREGAKRFRGSKVAAKCLYGLGKTFGMPRPSDSGALSQGIGAYKELIRRYPDSDLAPKAALEIAQALVSKKRTAEALEEVRRLLKDFQGRDPKVLSKAQSLLGDILRSQGKYEEAVRAYREYLSKYPDQGNWRFVQSQVVECEYEEALAEKKKGKEHYDEAIRLFRRFLERHPLDRRAAGTVLLIGKMEEERKNWKAAVGIYKECSSRFPRTVEAGEAVFRIGEIYVKHLADPVKAVETWKKLTWGSWAARAKAAVKRLKEPALSVFTERVYRTDEKPRFTVETRNIPKLRVRVFKLDLATFFRATHTASDVEKLRIEVIEPDKTFESEVKGYKPFLETRRNVEIPFRGPGAYVVKVDGKKLEATTLVVVSDLVLIAKAGEKGLFVFTENAREEKPEPGAKVVVSDGKKILVEGVTGKDGVFRWKREEPTGLPGLRVFAVSKSGSGASTFGFVGPSGMRGLKPSCMITLDRPGYRPGDKIRLKAYIRDVKDGVYVLPAIKDYEIEIYNPSMSLMEKKRVKAGEFGTVWGVFTLPGNAPLGSWKAVVRQAVPGGTSFVRFFQVDRFHVPQVRVTVVPKNSVIMRGEPLEGTVRLEWFYGEPLADEPVEVRVRVPGGTFLARGRTDSAGRFSYRFDTRDLPGERDLLVEAFAPGRMASGRAFVLVASVAMETSVSLVRDVYVQGEKVEARVKAVDRLGKPLATDLVVTLYRKVEGPGGNLSEVEEDEKKAVTGGETGTALVTFAPAEGGRYVIRVSGKDRFGNPVSGQAGFFVSGEKDKVKLRLLTDRERWRAGEKARVRVVNRAGRHLALFTTEAEDVEGWWVRVVPGGESSFDFTFDRKHAPNIRLAVCMPVENRLYQASRYFQVDPALRVEIRPGSSRGIPGGKMPLTVKVTDPSGRPLPAELGITVVDEAVLALFPWAGKKIEEFFYGTPRPLCVQTASSCTFSYRGKTRKVPQELLREEEMAKVRAGEARKLLELEKVFSRRRKAEAMAEAPAPATPGKNVFRALRRAVAAGRPQDSKKKEQLLDEEAELEDSLCSKATGGGSGRRGGKFRGPGAELAEPVPLKVLRSRFPLTAFWVPDLRTGKDGTARTEIPLPGNLTTWRIRVRGITKDTFVGQGEASFETRKPLIVEVRLPERVTAGDIVVPEALVRNLTDKHLRVKVEVPGENKPGEIDLEPGGAKTVPFRLRAVKPGRMSVTVRVSGGGYSDAVRRELLVEPLGTWRVAAASGLERGDRSVTLTLPGGKVYQRRILRVTLGGPVRRDLLEAALAAPLSRRCLPVRTVFSRVCRGLGALAALDLAERGPVPGDITARLKSLVSTLLVELAVTRKAGWSWNGGGSMDPVTTIAAIRFLVLAKKAGFGRASEILEKSGDILKKLYPRVRDLSLRARILETLSLSGEAPLEWLNSMRRNRALLDARGLSLLLSAYCNSGRPEAAGELAPRLRSLAKKDGPEMVYWEARRTGEETLKSAGFYRDRVETTGWAVKALLQVAPSDPLARAGARWLYARGGFDAWVQPLGRAAALEALCYLEGKAAARDARGEILVSAGGRLLGKVPAGSERSLSFVLEGKDLPPGPVRLEFSLKGEGRYVWRARLEGLTKGIDSDLRNKFATFERTVLAAPPVYEGKPLKPGFTVVEGPVKTFENRAGKVAVGGTVQVRLKVLPPKGSGFRGHLVVTDDLPGGCALVPGSVRGPVESFREEGGKVTFLVGARKGGFEIRYDLSGYVRGSFTALPAVLYAVEHPERITESAPGKLAVLERGTPRGEPYRLTPDELYQLGMKEFKGRKYKEAGKHLGALIEGWRLKSEPLKNVARALLDLASRGGEEAQVVKAFENLREAWPGVELPFDQVMQVGRAYVKLGEFERAGQVFTAVAEGSFMKEIRVAGTLESQGEPLEAAKYTLRLCLDYPSLPVVRRAFLAMAQELARKANGLAPGERLGEGGPGRVELLGKALHALREFLVLHPEDPRAPEATFALASDWFSLKRWKEALGWASAGARRYGKTRWADELLYMEGYAQFALGRYEASLKTLARVAEGRFPDGRGRMVESDSKWTALFLMGQIHHALGHRKEAEKYYRMVENRFIDAAENLAFLEKKVLKVPEVTVLKPGVPGKVKLSWRNLEKCEIRIYRVDLLRLYVLQGSLTGLGGVQLAGIRPYKELEVRLGAKGLLGEGGRKVELPVEKAGAYLLVAQSSDLVASGLVLRSGLELDVQEVPSAGRVSVYVMKQGKPVAGAYVKIVGDADRKFRSGETDLRGVFSVEGVAGRATVLVKAGEEYAFHRGEKVHLAWKDRRRKRNLPAATQMLQQTESRNFRLQKKARQELNQLFRNVQKGVQLR